MPARDNSPKAALGQPSPRQSARQGLGRRNIVLLQRSELNDRGNETEGTRNDCETQPHARPNPFRQFRNRTVVLDDALRDRVGFHSPSNSSIHYGRHPTSRGPCHRDRTGDHCGTGVVLHPCERWMRRLCPHRGPSGRANRTNRGSNAPPGQPRSRGSSPPSVPGPRVLEPTVPAHPAPDHAGYRIRRGEGSGRAFQHERQPS